MTTLAVDTPRAYETSPVDINELPVVASDIIYEGAVVGDNASGFMRPLNDGDTFRGFAARIADNSAGAAGAIDVKLYQSGAVELAVTGVVDEDDVGETVYCVDDNSFSLTDTGSDTAIGVITRHVSGTSCIVYFEAQQVRSL